MPGADESVMSLEILNIVTYISAVWCLSGFLVVSYFMEVVFVELSDKAGKVAVLEVLR
jgi:hypothetical protein